MSGCPYSVMHAITIPSFVLQNIRNQSCFVWVKSEKYSFWVTLRPKSDRCCWGKAKVCILDFKTTWSEFQELGQTATMRGEAELHTSNCSARWSQAMYIKTQFSVSLPLQCRRQAVVRVSTPRMHPWSGYFLVTIKIDENYGLIENNIVHTK